MTNTRNRFPARRKFLKQTAALSARAAIPASVVIVHTAAAERPPAPDAGAPRRARKPGSAR